VGADGTAHQPGTRESTAGGQQVAPLAGVLAVDGPDVSAYTFTCRWAYGFTCRSA
jgi:hypothetical protein